MSSKINKILLAKVEDHCAFCEQSEKEVKLLFIGSMGKGICDSCVGYVREKMGLQIPTLELDEIMSDA